MRLAALGLLIALLAGPLAAQAAQQPARFAVTLQGKIIDNLTYERMVLVEDCSAQRTGQGGRELAIKSVRPTIVEVSGGGSRVVYRPARIGWLRVASTRLAGSYTEIRRCRFLPPEKLTVECDRAPGPVRRLRAGFRSGRNSIQFGRPAPGRDVTACGLGQSLPGGWLHEASGRIDQEALLAGRSQRVFARASGTLERTLDGGPLLQRTQRTTVRWTLMFRRLQ
jgi:hypothetical protein